MLFFILFPLRKRNTAPQQMKGVFELGVHQ